MTIEQNSSVAKLDEEAKALGIDLDTSTEGIESNIKSDETVEPADAPKSEESKPESKPEEALKEESDNETVADETQPPTEEEAPQEKNEDKAFRRIRQKSKVDALRDEVKSELAEIKSLLKSRSPEAIAEAKDKYEIYAEKHNIDVNQVKELADILKTDLKPAELPQTEPAVPPKVDTGPRPVDVNSPEEKAIFEPEFNEFVPTILEKYPDATFAQMEKFKADLNVISHYKENLNRSLEQIYLKNEAKLKDHFFKPKSRSAESSIRRQNDQETKPSVADDLDADITSVEEAMEAQAGLERMVDEAKPEIRRVLR